MAKEKYMALADLQTVWTNSIKPWIVAGFIAVTPVASGATAKLVLQDGSLLDQSTFQPAGSYVLSSEKGANNGVATLGADGKVPSSQLPSYVDDVLEFANQAAFPDTGETGKIYVALDTNKTYRWGGSAYVVISDTLALGETQGTAYEGSKGKQVADNLAAHTGNTDIHVTTSNKSAWNAKYDKPTGGIPKTDLASAVQTSLGLADSALQSHQDISGKADKSATVSTVAYDTTNKKITKTINGSTTDVVSASTLKTDMGLTKSDVGLGNVGNFKAVSTVASQGLTSTEQSNARANIGAGTGSYSKPSGGIPKTDLSSAVQTSLGKADTALQSHQDISGKADKVSGATANNFAGLDSNGNLKDSGKKAADFATAAQGTKADSAIQTVKVNGVALTPDANKAVDIEVPNRVTAEELAAFVV